MESVQRNVQQKQQHSQQQKMSASKPSRITATMIINAIKRQINDRYNREQKALKGIRYLFKAPRSPRTKKSVCQKVAQPVYEQISISTEQDSCEVIQDISTPVFETIEMSCESFEECDVMVAGAEQIDSDFEDDNDDIDEESARKVYIQEMRKTTTSEVCGRQRKNFIRPSPLGLQSDRQEININKTVRKQLLAYLRISDETAAYNKFQSIAMKQFNIAGDIQNFRYQIVITLQQDEGRREYVGSHILNTPLQAISDIWGKGRSAMQRYQGSAFNDVTIFRFPIKKALKKKDQVKGGRHIMGMNKKYFVISPHTNTNCFYHCLIYYSHVAKGEYAKICDTEKIVDSAKKLKKRFNNKKDFSDTADLQEAANYYNTTFMVYDNLFRIKHFIKPKCQNFAKGNKISPMIGATIKLQFRNDHCLLLVNKSQNPHMEKYYTQIKKVFNHQSEAIIPKKPFNKQVDREIWSYDIECLRDADKKGQQVPFALGLCTNYNIETHDYKYEDFYGFDCIDKYLEFLRDYKPKEGKKKEIYLYAHNGAKYDIAIINDKLFKFEGLKVMKSKFMELGGGIINQEVHNEHGAVFIFRDSCRIFAGKLDDLCRDFKPKHMKLTGKVVFKSWNSENVMADHKANISDYLKHDCLSLAEIMIRFRQQLLTDPTTELDICDCFTSATMAKKLYFNKYYYKCTYINGKYGEPARRVYIYQLSRELDLDIRESYLGGRCDIYGYGKYKRVYYYDFTSLYPAVGAKFMMPIGNPVRVEGSNINIDKFYGFIRCLVTTNTNTLPLHGYKAENGKLAFAQHIDTEMMLFSEEIKRGLSIGNTYKFIYGYQFEQTPVLAQIMKDGFERKALEKEKGNPVMEKTWKIVINSAYGFFGLRWLDKRGTKFLDAEQLESYLEEGKVNNYNQIGADDYMVDLDDDLHDIKGKSVAIASAVTAHARMMLYAVMTDIQAKGHKIVYSDTDSIITTCNIKEYADLITKYQNDGCGKALGMLKNECNDKLTGTIDKKFSKNLIGRCLYQKIGKQIKNHILNKQLEFDGGELFFDECQILAPKVYSLRKTLWNGMVIEIAKEKGCSESSYDKQTQMLRGDILKSTVTQFRSGKNAYMGEQEFGKVYVNEVVKKCSLYDDQEGECKYTKGKIVGDDLKSLAKFQRLQNSPIGLAIYEKLKHQLYDVLIQNENWEIKAHLFVNGVQQ